MLRRSGTSGFSVGDAEIRGVHPTITRVPAPRRRNSLTRIHGDPDLCNWLALAEDFD